MGRQPGDDGHAGKAQVVADERNVRSLVESCAWCYATCRRLARLQECLQAKLLWLGWVARIEAGGATGGSSLL